MLPLHHDPAADVVKYVVRSSDVLDGFKLTVSEEGSEDVLWYKERFLSDEEIVDNIVDSKASVLLWTVHRPKRGWYIRLSSPSLPEESFIPLATLPSTSPFFTEGGLSFTASVVTPQDRDYLRSSMGTSVASSSASSSRTQSADSSTTLVHSYPPTPTQEIRIAPLSLRAISATTQYLLAPHSNPHAVKTEQQSVWTRIVATVRNQYPSRSLSFTLCPLPRLPSLTPDLNPDQGHDRNSLIVPTPLLTFHDRTSLWTVRSTTGILEINKKMESESGINRVFWISIALAYLDFLEDREAYLAAAGE